MWHYLREKLGTSHLAFIRVRLEGIDRRLDYVTEELVRLERRISVLHEATAKVLARVSHPVRDLDELDSRRIADSRRIEEETLKRLEGEAAACDKHQYP